MYVSSQALGNGTLLPGMQMCVRAPVCAITCKYGTGECLPLCSCLDVSTQ